jgi:hypothetical protein
MQVVRRSAGMIDYVQVIPSTQILELLRGGFACW